MSAQTLSIIPESPEAHPHIARVVFTEAQIRDRILKMGEELARDYQGKDLVIIGVLKGSLIFMADLSRAIPLDVEMDVVGAHSYRAGTSAAEQVGITKDLDLDIRDRHVLLVEDIYDSGRTLEVLLDLLRMHKPRSLEVCAFLYKLKPREHSLAIKYVGFEVEDQFVVGYGLDFKEKYRSLRYVGILQPELYQSIR